MSSLLSAAVDFIEIGEQPNSDYKPSFGIKSINYTSFQVGWYGKWKWLHYDQALVRLSLLLYIHSSSKARKS